MGHAQNILNSLKRGAEAVKREVTRMDVLLWEMAGALHAKCTGCEHLVRVGLDSCCSHAPAPAPVRTEGWRP